MTRFNKATIIARGTGTPFLAGELNPTEGIFILGSGMKKARYLGGFIPDEDHFIESIIYLKNQETAAGRAMPFHDACMKLASGKDVHLFCGSSQYCTTRVDVNKMTVIPKARVFVGEEMVTNKKTGKPILSRETGQPKMKEIWKWEKNVAVPTNANIIAKGFENDPTKTGATAQYFIQACKEQKLKYDLIVFDPPYSDKFDGEYGTADYNPMGVEESFIQWLANECLQILNPNGILLSKNWRSIRHPELQFIAGEATLFGGFRRFTIFEVWQYKPTKPLQFSFEFYENTWLKPEGDHLEVVPWLLGTAGNASIRERAIIKKYFNVNKTSNGIVITDNPADQFGNCIPVTMDQFNAMGNSIHDVIIINECSKLGASTLKTNLLKEGVIGELEWQNYLTKEQMAILKKARQDEEEENEMPRSMQLAKIVNRVAKDGWIYIKSYFDPNLTFYELELITRAIITYDNAGKSDLIHVYHKPVNWIVSQNIIENKIDALERWAKKHPEKFKTKSET